MFFPLLFSSVTAGLIATSVMLFFLYLPLVWQGDYYDILGAIGALVVKTVDARSRFVGAMIYYGGGFLFALLYGVIALLLMRAQIPLPQLGTSGGFPVQINLFYPLIGLVIGFGHGILAAFFAIIFFVEHYPLAQYKKRYQLVTSQLISHIVFGITVMFFLHLFLLLLSPNPRAA